MILFVGCGIVFIMHFLTSNEKTELIIWRAERETLPIKQRLLHELSIARLIKLDRLRRRKHLEYLWHEAKVKGGYGPIRILCGRRKDGEVTYVV